jgi:hypothetical protein
MPRVENEESQTLLERRGFLGVVGASVLAELAGSPLNTVAANEITPQTKELPKKEFRPDYLTFEVTIEREDPQKKIELKLDLVVLACTSSFDIRAILCLDPARFPDYANWIGRRGKVSGSLDSEATKQLNVPVIRISHIKKAGFVPEYFEIPRLVETPTFRLRLISVLDVVKDYEAVMSSRDHLWGTFPDIEWPTADMTIEKDFQDLDWHEREFEQRSSFCYVAFTPDESQEIAAIYVYPSKKISYDAKIILWVRSSMLESGFDQAFYKFTRSWISEKWPFKKVAYPGRDIPWSQWQEIQ